MHAQRSATPSTLYVSDLDFTLLGSNARLSEETVEVVNRVLDAGYHFTCATARSFTSTKRVTSRLELTLPVVTYAGAVTVDPASGAILDLRPMADTAVDAICAVTAEHPAVEPLLYAMVDGRDRVCWRENDATEFTRTFVDDRAGDPRLRSVPNWSELPSGSVFYATLIGERKDITAVYDELAPHLEGCFTTLGPEVYRPDQTWLEIHSLHATKAAALSRLRRTLGAGDLVAFGDNLIDIPMFELADHSCAVANAVPQLLAIADEIIASNDDSGVARWLANRLLT